MEQIAELIQQTKDKKHGIINDFVGGYGRYQDDFLPKIKGFIHDKAAQATDAMSAMMTPESLIFAGTLMLLATKMMPMMMGMGDKRKKRSAPRQGQRPSFARPSEAAEQFAKVIATLDQNDCISAAFCESAYSNPDSRGEKEMALLAALGVKLGGAMPWKESSSEPSPNSKFQYAEYVGYTSRQLMKEDGCRKVFTKCPIPSRILMDMLEEKYTVCDAITGKSPLAPLLEQPAA